jgi:hypothetical protein
MSELWYYAEGVETRGPFSLADLVGNLSKASDPEKVLVWRKGFENWKPVSAVSEVAGQMIRPPPLRPTPPRVVSPAEPPSKIYEPVVSGDLGALKDVKPPLSGIAGWLILIAIGQVVGVIKLLGSLAQYYGDADPKLFQQFPVTMWGEAALNTGYVVLAIYGPLRKVARGRAGICVWAPCPTRRWSLRAARSRFASRPVMVAT